MAANRTRPRSLAEWERDEQRGCTDPVRRLVYTRVPEPMRQLTWADYRENARSAEGESLRDILEFWAQEWTPETRDGVAVLGPPGRGKTMACVIALLQLSARGVWCKFSTEADWLDRRRDLIGLEQAADRTGDYERFNAESYRLVFLETECDVLLLDDVGKAYRSAGGYGDAQLDALLRRRTAAGKATLLTSNVALKDWKRFDPSLSSFLMEMGEVVTVDGADMRGQRSATAARRKRAR